MVVPGAVAVEAPAEEPLARRRLTDIVREHISRQIIAGTLSPGDSIPSESEIARTLKVSKTVVREALRELAAFGMVEIRQGRSTEVRPLDSEPLVHFFDYATRMGDNGLRDLMELLRAIESDAAGLAAIRHTDDEMARLAVIMEELRRSQHEPIWSAAHWDFHVLILEASRNELALFLFTALRRVIIAQKLFMRSQTHLRDAAKTYERQLAIFEAIKARDRAAASAAMRRHFDNALHRVERIMAERAAGRL